MLLRRVGDQPESAQPLLKTPGWWRSGLGTAVRPSAVSACLTIRLPEGVVITPHEVHPAINPGGLLPGLAVWSARQESNLHHRLRRPASCPLNDRPEVFGDSSAIEGRCQVRAAGCGHGPLRFVAPASLRWLARLWARMVPDLSTDGKRRCSWYHGPLLVVHDELLPKLCIRPRFRVHAAEARPDLRVAVRAFVRGIAGAIRHRKCQRSVAAGIGSDDHGSSITSPNFEAT